jgi:hypothetical protein
MSVTPKITLGTTYAASIGFGSEGEGEAVGVDGLGVDVVDEAVCTVE